MRHCWIWKTIEGRSALACDSCQRVVPGVSDSRLLPDEGCPGSLFAQQQTGDNPTVPSTEYLRTALYRGLTIEQIAMAWSLTPDQIHHKLNA